MFNEPPCYFEKMYCDGHPSDHRLRYFLLKHKNYFVLTKLRMALVDRFKKKRKTNKMIAQIKLQTLILG